MSQLRISSTANALTVGTRLGHYSLTALIGEGGKGIFVAVQPIR